jgi:hypothetical protein
MLCRTCQKQDWAKHKKHCGKSKVSKRLPGTIHDPLWAYPEVPEHLRHVVSTQEGTIPLTSIGFADPNSPARHSPALQRQMALLNADKDADYFLFDEDDSPVRFVLQDTWTKMAFRTLRSSVLSSGDQQQGLEAIAEYLIKMMGQKPGFSRQRILEQLRNEYEGDLVAKVAKFESMAAVNAHEGSTFIEAMSKNLTATMPALMGARRA